MLKFWIFVVVGACLSGCGDSGEPVGNAPATIPGPAKSGKQATKAALSLTGPKGTVAVGDPLAKAKAAFPPPKGAQEFDQSMNFAIVGGQGWAWALESDGSAFEVLIRDGKISGFAVTDIGKAPAPDVIEKTVAALGEATRSAAGKTAEAVVWEVGENARILVLLKTDGGLLGMGTLTVIGRKTDLNMLNYQADDPAAIVKLMDAGAEQTGKPTG